MPSASSMSARSPRSMFPSLQARLLSRAAAAGADLPADFRRLPARRAVEHPGGAGRVHRGGPFRHASEPHARHLSRAPRGFSRRGGRGCSAGCSTSRARRRASTSSAGSCSRAIDEEDVQDARRQRPASSCRRSAASASSRSPTRGWCSASAPSIRARSARAWRLAGAGGSRQSKCDFGTARR